MAQYDVPLRLVSPHMRGKRVKDAQWLMKGNSVFEGLATYKDGEVDGDYGILSAQATNRTKYYLGYPAKAIDGAFGQVLYEYLIGKVKLPSNNKRLRTQRLKKVVEKSPGLAAFEEAEKHIGYKETPVNHTKFGRWYGWDGVAWCAIFESYCTAHSTVPRKNFHYASVEAIYWDAVSNRNGLFIVRTPRRGDIIGYRIGGAEFAHTAFFDEWVGSNTLRDLGGNTGPSNISNGGMVMEQTRYTNIVRYYARIT